MDRTLPTAPEPKPSTEVLSRDYGCGREPQRQLTVIERASRAPRRAWWERCDLFWDQDAYAFQPAWRAHGHGAGGYVAGPFGERAYQTDWVTDFAPCTSRLLRLSHHVRGVVAALAAWHQMTAVQLAAHIGYPASKVSVILRPMYEAGLIERAIYPRQGPWQPRRAHVYRLRLGEPLEAWLAQLDDSEWLGVGLGAPLTAAGHFVRHNLLVGELVLRLEEVASAPLQAIFGERFASSDRLFGASSRSAHRVFGDACIVRADGLRIVVELVRRQRPAEVMAKMTTWGRLLSQAPRSTLGTVVVFLNASAPGRDHADRAVSLRRCHRYALSTDALGTGLLGEGYARSTIFTASWAEWFPAPHAISTEFAQLAVSYSDGKTWKRGFLLPGKSPNVLPFGPSEPRSWAKPARVATDPAAAAGNGSSTPTRYYGLPPWFEGPVVSHSSPAP